MRRSPNINFDRVNGKTVIFTGGVNENITNLELRPGDLFKCTNYEEIDGAFHGYRSVQGDERFDGQPAPSDVFVQLLPDSGNDTYTKFLLESEDDGDGTDKSESAYPVDTGDVFFNTSRSRVGEGSWYFRDGSDPILVDQSTDGFDFDQDEWTLELIFQRTASDQVSTYFQKEDCVQVRCVDNIIYGEVSTNGGTSYNVSLNFTTVKLNTWDEMKLVRKDDTLKIFNNGSLEASVSLSGGTIHDNTNDLSIGTDSSTDDMFIDSVRISDQARVVGDYRYVEDYLFSDPRYYVLNADDVDREAARDLIDPVPGNDDVLGVHIYKGDGYAIRDDSGESKLYKESSSGWVQRDTSYYIIEVDTSSIPDDTITKVAGEAFTTDASATGTVRDYVLHEGDPSSSLGEGLILLELTTGTLTNGDVLTVDGNTCTFISVPEVPKGSTGTDVDFAIGRFAYFPPEDTLTETMYYLNNDNSIFATDGTNVWSIGGPIGVTAHPTNIAIFANRLWVGYEDGSIFYSAVGDPSQWSGTFGAGEIKMGDSIVDLVEAPGSILVVIMRNSTKFIQTVGDVGVYNFKVDEFSKETGGYANTAVQLLGDVYLCDDRGPTTLKATDAYGDFEVSTIKKKAQLTYQSNKLNTVGAYVQRTKNQYRIFFNDPVENVTKAIFITFKDKQVKGTTLAVYPQEFSCFDEGEDSDGNIKILAGAKDGYVYKMDSGTSFDGAEITSKMTSAYYHYGTPRNWKRFHRVLFEISAENKTQFFVKPAFNYNSAKMLATNSQDLITVGQGGTWGFSQWGSFIWGGAVVSNPMVYMPGSGYNMSMSIGTTSKYYEAHTIHNMITDYATGSRVM